MSHQELREWEESIGTGVYIHDSVIEEVGPSAAIVFGKILSWCQPNKQEKTKLRVEKEGGLWLAKSNSNVAMECRISHKKARLAVEALVKANYLKVKIFRFNGSMTTHFQLGEKGRPFCRFDEPHKKNSSIRHKHPHRYPVVVKQNHEPLEATQVSLTSESIQEHTQPHAKTDSAIASIGGQPASVGAVAAPEGECVTVNYATSYSNRIQKEEVTSNWRQATDAPAAAPVATSSFSHLEGKAEAPVSKRLEQQSPPHPSLPANAKDTKPGIEERVSGDPIPYFPAPRPWPVGHRHYAHESHKPFSSRTWENQEERPKVPVGLLSAAVSLVRKKSGLSEEALASMFASREKFEETGGMTHAH